MRFDIDYMNEKMKRCVRQLAQAIDIIWKYLYYTSMAQGSEEGEESESEENQPASRLASQVRRLPR